ncbi:hypothetical protein C5O27_00790 [Gordonia alkanivorans]|nr:hypothetical protein C5O27_00790 [Gordonia alkanivorans]
MPPALATCHVVVDSSCPNTRATESHNNWTTTKGPPHSNVGKFARICASSLARDSRSKGGAALIKTLSKRKRKCSNISQPSLCSASLIDTAPYRSSTNSRSGTGSGWRPLPANGWMLRQRFKSVNTSTPRAASPSSTSRSRNVSTAGTCTL